MNPQPPHTVDTGPEDTFARRSLDDWLLILMLWALGVIVFSQFFSRYILVQPLGWTEEIARYFLIWLTFLGAATAVKRRSHIVVSFFYRYVPVRVCRVVSFCIDLVLGVFSLYLAWQSWDLTAITFQSMSSIPLSKSVIYYGTSVFLALMGVRMFITGFRSFTGKENCPLVTARMDFLALEEERKRNRAKRLDS